MALQRGEDMRLSGKLAIVTGSSRGIGLSIATSFAKEGAQVIICSRKKDNIENAAETLREIYPNQIFPYVLNTSHIERCACKCCAGPVHWADLGAISSQCWNRLWSWMTR